MKYSDLVQKPVSENLSMNSQTSPSYDKIRKEKNKHTAKLKKWSQEVSKK
jgi:hypothetical protein